MRKRTKVHLIVGARPNFVKVAPLHRCLRRWPEEFEVRLIHTGQHYDAQMSDVFFRDLDIPPPDVTLNVGSDLHGAQTGRIMLSYEPVVVAERPDVVLVLGDVNSTVACALVAAKQGVRVGHVEAGLRSFDRTMPEEINRVVTDAICDDLFTPSRDASAQLQREGVPAEKIHFVGNIMIDSLVWSLRCDGERPIDALPGLKPGAYAVLTLHRPSNVDDGETLRDVLSAIERVQRRIPVVFPVHPRTRAQLAASGLGDALSRMPNLLQTEPLGYREFLRLLRQCAFVMTDSGGLQEEATYLRVPCLTLRQNTERPVTVEVGTNVVVGTDPARICAAAEDVLAGRGRRGTIPECWDGQTAERIVAVLRRERSSRVD